ncbi:MAG: FAD-dependent oxidoreductase, partial [Pseudomonadota bacterium]
RRRLLAALTRNGIRLAAGSTISRIHPDSIVLADGALIEADFTVSAAGARPYEWISTTELAQLDGYISVDPYLRSLSHQDVFAVGDCAHMTETPREKAGVFAVRQAPVLLNNLQAALFGRALRPFQPQRDYLKLVSTGDKSAVALKYGLSVEGDWLWRLKDRIDRRFMRTLRPPNTH